MSQNRTMVPGMEDSGQYSPNGENNFSNDIYTRRSSSNRGTVVPGMGGYQPETPRANNGVIMGNAQPAGPVRQQPVEGKPVVGFLYSISRQGIGEYWPLHIGQNTIGYSDKCDIQLAEGTVSSEHAVLVVRKMKNPEKTIASISDQRSTNGTMVNGESLGFSAVECFNNDVITIGENYELVLLLVDVKALGLKVSEGFVPLSAPKRTVAPDFDPGFTRPGDMTPPPFYPNGNDGTVGFDGGAGGFNQGGTVGL